MQSFDRFLDLQQKISFHPELDPELEKSIEKLPPRGATLIRAASLYGDSSIPWSVKPPDIHYLSVAGRPAGANFLYRRTPAYQPPEAPGDFAGLFSLRPTAAAGGTPTSIVSELAGQIYPAAFGMGEIVDAATQVLRSTYGSLQPPWDSKFGEMNQHDRAGLERLRRDFPALYARIFNYIEFSNVLDEFQNGNDQIVFINLDMKVREDALKPFPNLQKFYAKLVADVTGESTFRDSAGHRLFHVRFDLGRIQVQFMIRNGVFCGTDDNLRPVGEPIDWSVLSKAHFVSRQSGHVHRLAMDFGLENVVIATDYRRDSNGAGFSGHMAEVPHVIAPPVVHEVMLMLAGKFMEVLAKGNGGTGLSTAGFSRVDPRGGSTFQGGVKAELYYSPSLEFLARIGDAIAAAHNEDVRAEERKLGEEFFNAFKSDYDRMRPIIAAAR